MAATVEFHTGVEEPVHFACRLLRKAIQAGARALVTAPASTVLTLDEQLWTFDDQSFIAHVRVPGASAVQRQRSPIWLLDDDRLADCPDDAPRLLINLGAEAPARPDQFDRVIEIVGSEGDARQAGRARWRHYETWGVTPLHHSSAN